MEVFAKSSVVEVVEQQQVLWVAILDQAYLPFHDEGDLLDRPPHETRLPHTDELGCDDDDIHVIVPTNEQLQGVLKTVLQRYTIRVVNVPYKISRSNVWEFFKQFGDIVRFDMQSYTTYENHRGIAVIQYSCYASYKKALLADVTPLSANGRCAKVKPHRPTDADQVTSPTQVALQPTLPTRPTIHEEMQPTPPVWPTFRETWQVSRPVRPTIQDRLGPPTHVRPSILDRLGPITHDMSYVTDRLHSAPRTGVKRRVEMTHAPRAKRFSW